MSRKHSNAPGIVQEVIRKPRCKKVYPLSRVDRTGQFILPCPYCGTKHVHGVPVDGANNSKVPHCVTEYTHPAFYTDPKGTVTEFTWADGYVVMLEVTN